MIAQNTHTGPETQQTDAEASLTAELDASQFSDEGGQTIEQIADAIAAEENSTQQPQSHDENQLDEIEDEHEQDEADEDDGDEASEEESEDTEDTEDDDDEEQDELDDEQAPKGKNSNRAWQKQRQENRDLKHRNSELEARLDRLEGELAEQDAKAEFISDDIFEHPDVVKAQEEVESLTDFMDSLNDIVRSRETGLASLEGQEHEYTPEQAKEMRRKARLVLSRKQSELRNTETRLEQGVQARRKELQTWKDHGLKAIPDLKRRSSEVSLKTAAFFRKFPAAQQIPELQLAVPFMFAALDQQAAAAKRPAASKSKSKRQARGAAPKTQRSQSLQVGSRNNARKAMAKLSKELNQDNLADAMVETGF